MQKEKLLTQLDGFYCLVDNWDGEGAKKINEISIEKAKGFITELLDTFIDYGPRSVAPTPYGGVLIYWRINGKYSEVTFDEDGHGFLCYRRDGEMAAFEDTDDGWFDHVIRVITKMRS